MQSTTFALPLLLICTGAGASAAVPTCAKGTVATYLGTSCSQGATVYQWLRYSCTSKPAGICAALGANGNDGAGVAAADAFLVTALSGTASQNRWCTARWPVPIQPPESDWPWRVPPSGSVPVLYTGPASGDSGLDQVNISIPPSLAGSGNVRVYLVADGLASNVVGLNIQ